MYKEGDEEHYGAMLMGSLLFARRVPAPGRCMLRTLEHAQDLDLRQLVEKLAQNGVADLTVSQMR